MDRRNFIYTAKCIFYSLVFFAIRPSSLFSKNVDSASMYVEKRKKSILIIHATYHGSTTQIAEFIAEKLNNWGIDASVKSINDDVNFSSYNGVIIGAPIHRGKWMSEAIDFVNKYRQRFDQLPFACFYTCMSKAKQPPSEDTIEELAVYQSSVTDLFPNLSPSCVGSFAGMLDYNKCSFLEKLVMWWIMSKNGLKAGDYRDWQAIESWLNDIDKYMIPPNKTIDFGEYRANKT